MNLVPKLALLSEPRITQVHSQTHLMEDVQAVKAIDPTHAPAMGRGDDGRAFAIVLGEDGVLRRFLQDPHLSNGWVQQDLHNGLPTGFKATQFLFAGAESNGTAVAFDADNRAYALSQLDGSGALPWSVITSPPSGTILHAAGGMVRGRPMAAIVVQSAPDAELTYYTAFLDETPSWRSVEGGPSLQSVTSLQVGRIAFLADGLYLLGEQSNGTVQAFFLTVPESGPHLVRELPGNAPSWLTAIPDPDSDGSLVFLGDGDNVYRLNSEQQLQKKLGEPIPGAQFDGVERVVALNTGDGQRVWVLDNAHGLHFGSMDASGTPTPFRTLRRNVAQFAAIPSGVEGKHDLIVVGDSGTLGTATQDPVTTLWTQHPIAVHAPSLIRKTQAVITRVVFLDALGRPAVGRPIQVDASTSTRVEINGRAAVLSQTRHATVDTDHQGVLSFWHRPEQLEGVAFRVANSDFGQTILTPSKAIAKELGNLSESELADATYPDGQHVVAGDYRKHLDKKVEALNHLLGAQAALPNAYGGKVQPIEDFAYRIDLGDRSLTKLDPASLDGGDVWDNVGDFVEALESGVFSIGDGVSFALRSVAEGVELVIDGIGSAVLKFAEQAWKAISWFLQEALHLLLKALLWLFGMFVPWEDIQRYHRAGMHVAKETFRMIHAELNNLSKLVAKSVGEVQAKIDEMKPPTGPQFETHVMELGAGVFEDALKDAGKEALELIGDVVSTLTDPVTNWAPYKFVHDNILEKVADVLTLGVDLSGVVEALVEAVSDGVFDEMHDIAKLGDEVIADVLQGITDAASGGNLASVIKVLIERVGLDTLSTVVGSVNTVDQTLIKLIDIITTAVEEGMTNDLEVPIFGPLYREFISTDGSFSVLDMIMLVPACAAGGVFNDKLGTAILKDEVYDELMSSSYEEIFHVWLQLLPDAEAEAVAISDNMKSAIRDINLVRGLADLVYGFVNTINTEIRKLLPVNALVHLVLNTPVPSSFAKPVWASGTVVGLIALNWLLGFIDLSIDCGIAFLDDPTGTSPTSLVAVALGALASLKSMVSGVIAWAAYTIRVLELTHVGKWEAATVAMYILSFSSALLAMLKRSVALIPMVIKLDPEPDTKAILLAIAKVCETVVNPALGVIGHIITGLRLGDAAIDEIDYLK